MSKRARNIVDADGGVVAKTPRKRARFETNVIIPRGLSMNLSPGPTSTPFTTYSFKTPSSLSHTLAFSNFDPPSDSPSNPFGMRRSLTALALPCPLPFGRHLALRFQLVCNGKDANDVYRIVQVPKNYSFRILHKLIMFLFASDARLKAPVPGRIAVPHRRTGRKRRPPVHATILPPVVVEEQKIGGEEKSVAQSVWRGHSFDIFKGISAYRGGYKRGLIRRGEGSGTLSARLSAEHERQLFAEYDWEKDDLVDEDIFGGDELILGDGSPVKAKKSREKGNADKRNGEESETKNKKDMDAEDDDDDGWMWETEDDFTVGHVWPDLPDASRGIIYHHVPGVSVHITINAQRIPQRKGSSNSPFVFRTHGKGLGAVRIAHIAAPTALPQHDPDDEADWEERTDEARLRHFHKFEAFKHFLAREAERETLQLTDPAVPSPPSTPTKVNNMPATPVATWRIRRPPTAHVGKVTREGTLPPSSPPSSPQQAAPSSRPSIFPDRSSYPSVDALTSRSSMSVASSPFPHPTPISLPPPTLTPDPAHPIQRRRVERLTRRMERLTKKGLGFISSDEEEEEDQLKDEEDSDGAFTEIVQRQELEREHEHQNQNQKRPGGRARKNKSRKVERIENSPELDYGPVHVENSPELGCGSAVVEHYDEDLFAEDQEDTDSEGWKHGWVPLERLVKC